MVSLFISPVIVRRFRIFSFICGRDIWYKTSNTSFVVYDSLPMPLHDGLMVVVLDINRLLEGLCYAGSGPKQSTPPPTLKLIKVSVHAILISHFVFHIIYDAFLTVYCTSYIPRNAYDL